MNSYDVSIIGAGISGLVCGCYLAKAGVKTIIVEQNAMPGGYCVSFKRKDFNFDACAHSLGGLRNGGPLKKIFDELNLHQRIQIHKYEPTDVVISPEHKIQFCCDLGNTIKSFKENFPKEGRKIEKFFYDINELKHTSFSLLRNRTFDDFLNLYFKDEKLKSILSLPILGNASLSALRISAFTAVALYKEFILDGGYYPKNGMQEFPNLLMNKFKEFGGEVILKERIDGIIIKNNCVDGIKTHNGLLIRSKYVVSNIDARQTFLRLIGKDKIDKILLNYLENFEPSLSIFILYLGTDGKIKDVLPGTNTWYLSDFDVNEMYKDAKEKTVDAAKWFMVRLSPDAKSMMMLVTSSYGNDGYWNLNRKKTEDVFIKKIEKIIPGLSDHIILKSSATPKTLNNWTSNYRGAAYGWAGIPSQFAIPGFSQSTSIKDLYLTGHWTTLVQGVPGVAYLGRDTAKIIINKRKKRE